jgi:peptidoglycan/LPS O-acetylase OafA/YrhL
MNLTNELVGVLLVVLVTIRGYRIDKRDRPLAMLLGYIRATTWIQRGLYALYPHLVFAAERAVIWLIDVFFVSYFAGNLAVAIRYRSERWPRLWRWALPLCGFLALVQIGHVVQLKTVGLWHGHLSVRWIILQVTLFSFALAAAIVHAKTLRTVERIAPAHLYLAISILMCLVQVVLVFRPQSWSLYVAGVTIAEGSGCLLYLLLLAKQRFRNNS